MAKKPDTMTKPQARAAYRNLFAALFAAYTVWLGWRRLIDEPNMGAFFIQLLIGAAVFAGLYAAFRWLIGRAPDDAKQLEG